MSNGRRACAVGRVLQRVRLGGLQPLLMNGVRSAEILDSGIVMARLDPRLSGSVVLRSKPAQIRRPLPLTLPLRGSLPLPARAGLSGEKAVASLSFRSTAHLSHPV